MKKKTNEMPTKSTAPEKVPGKSRRQILSEAMEKSEGDGTLKSDPVGSLENRRNPSGE
ncbi:hypothetical protein [Adhaeretor mobilis]|uniref:Uncharacterized protein n=1 Tax=Adhaeretor mobilis TaxID=1930276 RepID=A0A517MQQ6_9BACT|nr:hypothetical protein [Adhaeretor mobilis]QDS97213.1 hypothetical protein HG15A2_04730 [Adhaeretor mobilis]